MPLSRRRVTSPSALKALAHPVRIALLDLLVAEGARTATQAGAALGQTPANCSWHLRKLAEHGFVREVTGAPGRNRPWRAVTEALTWGDPEDEAGVDAAGEAVSDTLLERELQRLRAARAARATEPPAWRGAASVHQVHAWLTADEARELSTSLAELFASHALERSADPSTRPDGSRLVSLVGWIVPSGPASTAEG